MNRMLQLFFFFLIRNKDLFFHFVNSDSSSLSSVLIGKSTDLDGFSTFKVNI